MSVGVHATESVPCLTCVFHVVLTENKCVASKNGHCILLESVTYAGAAHSV